MDSLHCAGHSTCAASFNTGAFAQGRCRSAQRFSARVSKKRFTRLDRDWAVCSAVVQCRSIYLGRAGCAKKVTVQRRCAPDGAFHHFIRGVAEPSSQRAPRAQPVVRGTDEDAG